MYHIFPSSSWSGQSIEHWALLIIPGKVFRYYETLNELKKGNAEAAAIFLKVCGFEEVKLERVNLARQLEVECGEAVIHYVELEARQAMGEGWGSVPGFTLDRRREMKNKLGSATGTLQKIQAEYKEQLASEELHNEQLKKFKDAALGKAHRMVKETEDLKAIQKKTCD